MRIVIMDTCKYFHHYMYNIFITIKTLPHITSHHILVVLGEFLLVDQQCFSCIITKLMFISALRNWVAFHLLCSHMSTIQIIHITIEQLLCNVIIFR